MQIYIQRSFITNLPQGLQGISARFSFFLILTITYDEDLT